MHKIPAQDAIYISFYSSIVLPVAFFDHREPLIVLYATIVWRDLTIIVHGWVIVWESETIDIFTSFWYR